MSDRQSSTSSEKNHKRNDKRRSLPQNPSRARECQDAAETVCNQIPNLTSQCALPQSLDLNQSPDQSFPLRTAHRENDPAIAGRSFFPSSDRAHPALSCESV